MSGLPPRLHLHKGETSLADLRVAKDVFSRFLGLMGVRDLPPGTGLLLSPCNSIHTWFMRFPIDVLFLDASWRVVRILPSMAPWRFGPLVRGARMAVEVPAGAAGRAGIAPGDRLAWEPLPRMQ